MGADVAAVSIVSVFWVVVGAIVPWFIRKGSHRSLIQAMIVTTSICCYLFWLCTYMSQIVKTNKINMQGHAMQGLVYILRPLVIVAF
ncbi:hypothetical protein MRX96_025092 [Rhipicephalus microplus]